MKKFLVLVSSVICLLTASNADAYQDCPDLCVSQCTDPCFDPCVGECESSCGRFYAGAYGGASWLHVSVHTTIGSHFKVHDLKTEIGYCGALSLGYKILNGFFNGVRLEGEISFRKHQLNTKKFTVNNFFDKHIQVKLDGNAYAWAYMANILYDMEQHWLPNFVPYVGLGIGYMQSKLKLNVHAKNNYDSGRVSHGHSKNGFAYQIIAGWGYNITDCIVLAVEYRYISTKDDFNDNSVGLALRKSF